MITKQVEAWSGEIGKAYTDRNALSLDEWEKLYLDRYGLTRTELNTLFIGNMPRDIKILEVGCNIGNQLAILQKMGFSNLYGIELQPYAVKIAKQRTNGINIIQGSAFDIPFEDNFFDLVFTSTVLIHFRQEDLPLVMKEICRCSNKYIWGLEFYNKEFIEAPWRGNLNLMWKADYPKIYLEQVGNLTIIKKIYFKYLNEDGDKIDCMYLLEKVNA